MYLYDSFLAPLASVMIPTPDESTYATWAEQLQNENWQQVKAVYGDTVQMNVLRALAIDGVPCVTWPTVFAHLVSEGGEWFFIKQSWFEHQQIPDLDWFTRAVATTISYREWLSNWNSGQCNYYQTAPRYDCYLPPVLPMWLLDYGYTQAHYIQDLRRYWSDIYPVYYHPWPGTLIGDISSITTIRALGTQAKREIGTLFNLAREQVQSLEVCPDVQP